MPVQTKHFLNTPASLVLDSLEGLCHINTHLALDAEHRVVSIASPDRSKVALLCGGGSGHEPAHAGFVGDGILTAAVCGNIFASPNASQISRGIDLVDNDNGILIIVKNYTGDVLNFGLAKEKYASLYPEKADHVKFVIVGDDVAVGKTQGEIVGRRGLAGTVLVYKIAGALARRGANLDEVYDIAQWVASRLSTIGVSIEHCHVPGTTISSFSQLSPSEYEVGMGIHNEPGIGRAAPVPSVKELISRLLQLLTSTADPDLSFTPFEGGHGKDNVVLLVNNLGGISELELGGVVAEVCRQLDAQGIVIHRVLAGTFMTSLNMPGFSITLLLLPTPNDPFSPSTPFLLSLLDEKTDAPGWKWSSSAQPVPATTSEPTLNPKAAERKGASSIQLKSPDPAFFTASIERACKALVTAEPEITRLDSISGDGDCGLTLQAGAEAILKKLVDGSIHGGDVVGAIIAIAQVAAEVMGGTSGALYSIFFSALAQGLQSHSTTNAAVVTPEVWAYALSSALTKLYSYTRARPPSRTLVDPLAAFIDTLKDDSSKFGKAVKAARVAAEATRDMDAKAGRSAYVDGDRLRQQKVADPGAWGVHIILEGLVV